MNIAFFGTPRLAQIVLENLIASEYKPILVVATPDVKAGRGQILTPPAVKATALGASITLIQPIDLSDSSQFTVHSSQLDLAILVAYGQLIPKEILSTAKLGFINLHPSLLPKYRGPSPIQSAIIAGDNITGITIIKLDEELDHGPILAQKEVAIEETDTHLTLIEKLGAIGSNLLLETLPDYISGKIKPQDQNHAQATMTKKITKEDGHLDLFNPPNPLDLHRMIRAYYPWPSVWTKLSINPSDVRASSSQFTVKLLPNKMIQPEGKKPMTFEDFKNGNPKLAQSLDKIL